MNDEHYLKLALQQAEMRRGFCAPNPAVGAVIVKNNQVLSAAHHHAAGFPHAEIAAFAALKNKHEAEDATLYVTLEPCCHHGKTPPCTDAIIQHKIKKVIYGFRDLNPQVAQKSEAQLKAVGIESIHVGTPEITAFYESYAHWWKTKTPFVTAKLAISLDGKIAGKKGEPIHITDESTRIFTHQHRQHADALLTTAKTLIHDNPQLNVRLGNGVMAKPLYILDTHLNTPLNSQIFQTCAETTFFHADNIDPKKIKLFLKAGAKCIAIDSTTKGLNLKKVLEHIGKDGIQDLWIEAGGKCFQSFLEKHLLQKAYIYIAPKFLGNEAQSAFTNTLDFPKNITNFNWKMLGNDIICEMYFTAH